MRGEWGESTDPIDSIDPSAPTPIPEGWRKGAALKDTETEPETDAAAEATLAARDLYPGWRQGTVSKM